MHPRKLGGELEFFFQINLNLTQKEVEARFAQKITEESNPKYLQLAFVGTTQLEEFVATNKTVPIPPNLISRLTL